MACDGISFTAPDGTTHCIPIYYELDWKIGPDPGPEGRLFRDLGILATVNQGIAKLSDRRLRDTLSQAIVKAARDVQLPQGMKLGDGLFHEQKAFMAAE